VSASIDALIAKARLEAGETNGRRPAAGDRERLDALAAEFESMLLVQVLRDMRRTGSWDDEGEGGLNLESLFETLDVELASHLSRSKGFGLAGQLIEAFERLVPEAAGAPAEIEMPALTSPATPVSPEGAGADVGAVVSERIRPVAGTVTSAFGWRADPLTGAVRFHSGVDLRAAYGEAVQAADAGRVVFSGDQGDYGTTVVLEHADASRTRYAHLSAAIAALGDVVEAGQLIGRAGRSGRATGAHLHFEVLAANGRAVVPELTARSGRVGRAD
jgi:murein DD-endopeptidase MepM/ murein hydrolase activator NlpD